MFNKVGSRLSPTRTAVPWKEGGGEAGTPYLVHVTRLLTEVVRVKG